MEPEETTTAGHIIRKFGFVPLKRSQKLDIYHRDPNVNGFWERPDSVPNVCVRFTLQGWKSDSNHLSLADIETA